MEAVDEELQRIRERKIANLMDESSRPPTPSTPLTVTDAEFDDTVARYELAVVDCGAPWCGPCQMLTPVIDRLAERFAGQAVFLKLNTDENQRTAARFAVMSIPTVLIFKNGFPVERLVGAQPENVIEAAIRRHQ
jgi:thioredoxin 1